MRLKAWTLDSVEDVAAIVAAIRLLNLPELWLRIVCDVENSPEWYSDALSEIKQCGPQVKIMVQIVDSSQMKDIRPPNFKRRVKSLLNALYPFVDMVECGNEVNGDWLGSSITVKNKVAFALEECRKRKLPTAVTYYITPDVNDMLRWIKRYPLPHHDYALLSWYPYSEGTPSWNTLFPKVTELLPKSLLGIGEYGIEGIDTRTTPAKLLEAKKAIVRTVESLAVIYPRTIGFGGYWDAYQDCVKTGSLLPTFKELW